MPVEMTYTIMYTGLIAALLACIVFSKRSSKPASGAVAWINASLIIPISGNLIIILCDIRALVLIGQYMYFLGIDLLLLSLVHFTNTYCTGIGDGSQKPTVMYAALAVDAFQMLLNIFFGHAFSLDKKVDGDDISYIIVSHFGLTIHRIIGYAVLTCVIMIFFIASVKTPKIHRERYTVLLTLLMLIGIMQAYYIFTGSDFVRPVIGYGFFGLVIFYFAIIYRPLRLLDKMLSNIVSDLSDAFFVFDSTGKCIWANDQGCALVGFSGSNYEEIGSKLTELFGSPEDISGHVFKKAIGEGDDMRFYSLEEKQVTGENGKNNGSYLRIQDVTEEENEIKVRDEQIGVISQAAYRDALTGVGNKAAYIEKIAELNAELEKGLSEIAIVMVDINDLKQMNDIYGHKSGDIYIKGCCKLICDCFKFSPVFRIGGDEFAAILMGKDFAARQQNTESLEKSFEAASADSGLDPWQRYSASVGISEYTADDISLESVFKRADQDMYENKKAYKQLYGSYRK